MDLSADTYAHVGDWALGVLGWDRFKELFLTDGFTNLVGPTFVSFILAMLALLEILIIVKVLIQVF